MKSYAAVIACLTLASASVVYAEQGAPSAGASMDKHAQSALSVMNADDIEGKEVVDSSGHELGDVDEVVRDKSNHVMVVIGLEDSMKEVAVPMEKLTLTADGKGLTTSLTRAQLEAMPDYDPMDMESVDE